MIAVWASSFHVDPASAYLQITVLQTVLLFLSVAFLWIIPYSKGYVKESSEVCSPDTLKFLAPQPSNNSLAYS